MVLMYIRLIIFGRGVDVIDVFLLCNLIVYTDSFYTVKLLLLRYFYVM